MSTALDLLLRVRELREREARQRLGDAQREQQGAERRLLDARDRLLARPRHDRGNTAAFLAEVAARTALATDVAALRARADEHHRAVLAARQGWLVRDQDRDAADRLVARVREETRQGADRADTRESDDAAAGRHIRGLGAGEERPR